MVRDPLRSPGFVIVRRVLDDIACSNLLRRWRTTAGEPFRMIILT